MLAILRQEVAVPPVSVIVYRSPVEEPVGHVSSQSGGEVSSNFSPVRPVVGSGPLHPVGTTVPPGAVADTKSAQRLAHRPKMTWLIP